MVGLGTRERVLDQLGHLGKVVLARFQVADDDLELGQAVQQCRQPAALLARQIPKPLHELLHHFPFAVAATPARRAAPRRTGAANAGA